MKAHTGGANFTGKTDTRKSMLLKVCVMLGVFYLQPVLAGAEIYQYMNNAVVCFTDDISKVPEQQIESVKKIAEIKSPSDIGNRYPGNIKGKKRAVQQNTEKQISDKEAEQLNALKRELDKEYQSLQKRKAELTTALKKKMSSKEIRIHNQLVKKLNKDSTLYMEKKEIYEKRGAAYH